MEQSAITIDAPLSLYTDSVRPEWIDYNGHMNVAYYVLLVDRAMDGFLDFVGLGHDYVKAENKSLFAVDSRIAYLRELTVGTPVRCKTQLFGYDAKRYHVGHYVEHADEGWTAAVTEWIGLHVDLATRRSTPLPNKALAVLQDVMAAHASLPRPEALGRPLGLARADN